MTCRLANANADTDFEYSICAFIAVQYNSKLFEYERMDYFEGEFRKSKVQKVEYLMMLRIFRLRRRRIHVFEVALMLMKRDGKLFVM